MTAQLGVSFMFCVFRVGRVSFGVAGLWRGLFGVALPVMSERRCFVVARRSLVVSRLSCSIG